MKHRSMAMLVWVGLILATAALTLSRHRKESGLLPDTSRPGITVVSHKDRMDSHPVSSASPTLTNLFGNPTPEPAAAPMRKRPWDPGFLPTLNRSVPGDSIQFELVAGEMAIGRIRYLLHKNEQVTYVSGEVMQPRAGQFFFQKQALPGVAGEFVGVVTFSDRAYRLEPSGPGRGTELVERPLDQVLCHLLPPAAETNQTEAVPPYVDPLQAPIPPYQNGIVVLESLPGAVAVIYLDFQGGYNAYTGITYQRPNVNNDQIHDVWVRVAEDFRPFNINVTTDLEVYQTAPENSRQRVIITPTTTAGPGTGGIAFVGSFNWTGDIPCWVFTSSGKACAEACSHEAGHTLSLNHKGYNSPTLTTNYFAGQGTGDTSWAPIMGLPYYAAVTQWSRGEYLYADNFDDELASITHNNNNVVYRSDDTGNTLATSRYLELYDDYSAFAQGVIERTDDTDAFQFTTSGGPVELRADPLYVSPNLAVKIALHDQNDALLAASDPQNTLWASLATNLPAGTYTFRVTGAGRNDPLTTGFSSYGSLGYFSITGFVANARLPNRFSVSKYETNGAAVGAIPVSNPNSDPLIFRLYSTSGQETFGIDSSGVISITDNSLLDRDTLASRPQRDVQFELFVDIIDPVDATLTETNRRVVITLNPGPNPPLIGQQPHDTSVDAGTDVSFLVEAHGDLPLSYQWLYEGSPLAGATSSALYLTNAQQLNEGGYSVVITNAWASVASRNALLAIRPAAPTIHSEPETQVGWLGFPVSLSVSARGSDPLLYQWQFNDADLPGATDALLFIPEVTTNSAGVYRAVVSNAWGRITSAPATLVVKGAPPVVISQPASQRPFLGGQATLEVLAQGSPPLAFQWCFGSAEIPGATAPSLVLPMLRLNQSGPYTVRVTNDFGSVTSSQALLNVMQVVAWGAGTNYATPEDRGQSIVPSGLERALKVAGGWFHSVALAESGRVAAWGAGTNSSGYGGQDYGQSVVPAGLSNVISIAAGGYHTLALRSDGTVAAWGTPRPQTMVPIALTDVVDIAAGYYHSVALQRNGTPVVWASPSFPITNQPPTAANLVGISANGNQILGLRAGGSVVRWGDSSFVPKDLSNVVAVAAGVSHCLALRPDGTVVTWGKSEFSPPANPPAELSNVVQVAAGSGFSLALRNDGTLVTWGECSPPSGTSQIPAGLNHVTAIACGNYHALAVLGDGSVSIVTQPQGFMALASTQSFLRVAAVGTPPLLYQWRLNGLELAGATDSVLRFPSLSSQDAGRYQVIVTDISGSAASQVASVTLVTPAAPRFVTQPVDQTAGMGAQVTLVCAIEGLPEPALQWFKNGTVLPGATAPMLVISHATRRDSGWYQAMATNLLGTSTSDVAVVSIHVPQRLKIRVAATGGPLQFLSDDADGSYLLPSDLSGFRPQVSTNLLDWFDLPVDLGLTNGMLLLTDPQSTNAPCRFYRILETEH